MSIFNYLLIAFTLFVIKPNDDIPFKKELSFKPGEQLTYKVKYGFITAAEATIKVEQTEVKFENKNTYHLVAEGKTSGSFDVFYKVRSRYDSYIDRTSLTPYLYIENTREDNYTRVDKARFYQDQKKVIAKKGTFISKSEQTFDMISAFYFARNLDMTNVKPKDKFTINYFLDDEITPMPIQYIGKETIRTSLGKISCLKFSPGIKAGRVFRKNSRLYLWISDDKNRVPVKAQVEVIIGSVTLELQSSGGLKYPN